jgi:ribosome maturation factor RimP
LERKLVRAEDYVRFAGSLVKVKTFAPVKESRVWTGRLVGFADGVVTVDLSAVKQKKRGVRDQGSGTRKSKDDDTVEIELRNVEKANLVISG